MKMRELEMDRASFERAVREINVEPCGRLEPFSTSESRYWTAERYSGGSASVKEARIKSSRAGRFNGWTSAEESALDMLGDIFGV